MRGLLVKRRTAMVFIFLVACLGVIVGRLLYVQGIRASRLQKMAVGQRFHQVPVDARRGKILDRNYRILATSIHADCVGAIPAEIDDTAAVAELLGPILDMETTAIRTKLEQNAAFVWLKRRISRDQAQKIKDLHLPGLVVEPKAQRFYPARNLAGQLLGFAGSDNQGLEGLEVFYDSILRGSQGWDMAEFSAVGLHIPGGESHYQEPVDGDTLVLTIDEGIQFIAERELEMAVAETGAKRGLVILMDASTENTGEILAMAAYPRVDPANFLAYPPETWKNACLTDQFEPGSIFKVITAAAALEEGAVKTSSTFFDPGYLIVDDRRLRCWHDGGHGSQTFVEAIENSCNPVFASLALSLGAERFQRYIKAFGFGARTGIDAPGEATGTVPKPAGMKRVELATMGFGQGVSVTPIQLVAAMNAVANGGYLVQPRLLRGVMDSRGQLVRRGQKNMLRQVISRETSATMRMLLESVVVNGSGNRAGIPGYRIAGKTGTAQKPSRGGYGSEVVASFIGFAPANQPRLVGLVILDEPKTGIRYGGVIAAPVFGRIISAALRHQGIKPMSGAGGGPRSSAGEAAIVPNVTGLTLVAANQALNKAGFHPRPAGRGEMVIEQMPAGGATVNRGTVVLLYLDPGEKYNRFDPQGVIVPDLSGTTPAEAQKILARLGLRLQTLGDGTAAEQNPRSGERVMTGTPVAVRFKPREAQR